MPGASARRYPGGPELEDRLAEVLVAQMATGTIWRCSECETIELVANSVEPKPRAKRCQPGARHEPRYRIAQGRIELWRGRDLLIAELAALLEEYSELSLAVLFGSRAGDDARPLSDFDLAVEFAPGHRPRARDRFTFAVELTTAFGWTVDVALAKQLRAQDPILWAEILSAGKPLLDRRDRWSELLSEREAIERAANEAAAEGRRKTQEALDYFASLVEADDEAVKEGDEPDSAEPGPADGSDQ